jgi:hypothetical protein
MCPLETVTCESGSTLVEIAIRLLAQKFWGFASLKSMTGGSFMHCGLRDREIEIESENQGFYVKRAFIVELGDVTIWGAILKSLLRMKLKSSPSAAWVNECDWICRVTFVPESRPSVIREKGFLSIRKRGILTLKEGIHL